MRYKQIDNNHTNITTAFLGLGTNLGDRASALKNALSALGNVPTIKLVQMSSVYETAPVGVADQPEFLNAVAKITTSLDAQALLQTLLHIENQMGRVRTFRWGPRVIDIDLLLYGEQIIAQANLIVPHPRLCERAFALVPLAEIAPDLILPGETRTTAKLAASFTGNGNIRRVSFV